MEGQLRSNPSEIGLNSARVSSFDQDQRASAAVNEKLDLLKMNGDLERVIEMAEEKAPVFIRRTDGTWNFGRVNHVVSGGLGVSVAWKNSEGVAQYKTVDTADFLQWQVDAETDAEAQMAFRRASHELREDFKKILLDKVRERSFSASEKVEGLVVYILDNGYLPPEKNLRISLLDRNDPLAYSKIINWTDDQIRELYSVLYDKDIDEVAEQERIDDEAAKIEKTRLCNEALDGIEKRIIYMKNEKVKKTAEAFCLGFRRHEDAFVLDSLSYMQGDFENLARMDQQERDTFADTYKGWSSQDIKDYYFVLYGEKINI